MVAGLAYVERLRRLGSPVTVTLQPERENRYFLRAIAVLANEQKVGALRPKWRDDTTLRSSCLDRP